MLIKASRITNLTDARYFAAKEVDFLGFNLEEGTEGYLDPIYMKAIREWVEGPKIVGEFSRSSVAWIREAAAFFGLDAVQVTTDYVSQLADLEGLTVILEIAVNDKHTPAAVQKIFQETSPFVSYFLVKMTGLQLSESFQLSKSPLPVLLQTDASAEQLPALSEKWRPAGLSLVGGEEEQTGVKSFDEIEAIFEALGR